MNNIEINQSNARMTEYDEWVKAGCEKAEEMMNTASEKE